MPHIHEKIDFTTSALIVRKNKVLLRRHDKYKVWLSVGGHIELDEDPNQAVIREVKIIDEQGSLLLSVRGASAHQEIRVYADDFPKAKLAIARAIRNADFHLSFGNRLQAE